MTSYTPSGVPVRLDELDLRLIKALESDPRRTHTDLAAELGVSRPTVGNMMQRLFDARVIQTVCLADHRALGYTNSVFFRISTQPGKLRDVAEGLASFPDIHYVTLCAGPFDVACWGVFKGYKPVLEFIEDGLGKISGLRYYESVLCQEIKISPALLTEGQGYCPGGRAVSLDELDLALIGALQRDSRQGTTGLSTRLGISKPTVLKRMRRLLDERVIKFATMVNPVALGYKGNASIGMKVAPDRLRQVAEAVSACRSIHTVALCTGRYDILAWAIFQDQRELMNILIEEVGKVPGVNSMETVTNLRTIKASYISVDWQADLWNSLKNRSSS